MPSPPELISIGAVMPPAIAAKSGSDIIILFLLWVLSYILHNARICICRKYIDKHIVIINSL